MKIKPKKQVFLIVFLLSMLILQLYLCHVKAEPLIVNVQNGKLYYPATTTMRFQHPSIEWISKGAIITLNVVSGTLNGSAMSLRMQSTQGILTFTSQNTSAIALSSTSDSTTFRVNGEITNSASIMPSSNYQIEWSIVEPVFLLPIMFILGMFGLGSMFVGPMYGIYKVKHGEYYDGFKTGLVVTVLGVALTIAWLWSV